MKTKWFLLLLLLIFTTGIFAQQKKYVSYTVKRGETMKSIAADYQMSTKDLMRLNPGVKRKPRRNTVIIVPNPDFGKVVEVVKYNRSHTVKPKETIFGIAKMYGVTMEALIASNPMIEEGLQIDMKLAIPEPTITQLKDTLDFVLHEVVKDDTKFNLSKRYEISQEELERMNPMLSEGLKLGMLLKIKPKEEEPLEEEEVVEVLLEEFNFDKSVSVALMLPYQTDKFVDSTRIENFKVDNSLLNYATEFHMGAMMAVDSLRRLGLDVQIDYFDTENSRFKLQYLLNTSSIRNADLVIGPLFFENATMVADRVSGEVVLPFYSRKQENNSSRVISSAPNALVKEALVLEHMEATYAGEHILVVNDEKPENQSKLWRVVEKLKKFDSIQGLEVIKTADGFIDGELFKSKIDTLGQNWVLLISDEIVTTAATVNNLKLYADWVDIDFFALNKGRNFNAIDNIFLGKLNFVFPSGEFFNYNNDGVRGFYDAYRRRNHADPTDFAIRGFDVTYDAIVRLNCFDRLDNSISEGRSMRFSGVFDYGINDRGILENTGLYLIQYTPEATPILLK